jgi:ElaB/YqjD/DUF883 family membrane-anchored ribosome-binding protein
MATTNRTESDRIGAAAINTLHGTVDKAASAVGEAAMGVLPAVEGAARGAHEAVDRVADAMATPQEWVAAHPLQALGIAFATGLVIGRISRW